MKELTLPENIQNILDKYNQPDAVFAALIPALGEVLQCDRTFLYLRNPQTKMGKVDYCLRRNQDIPLVIDKDTESRTSIVS